MFCAPTTETLTRRLIWRASHDFLQSCVQSQQLHNRPSASPQRDTSPNFCKLVFGLINVYLNVLFVIFMKNHSKSQAANPATVVHERLLMKINASTRQIASRNFVLDAITILNTGKSSEFKDFEGECLQDDSDNRSYSQEISYSCSWLSSYPMPRNLLNNSECCKLDVQPFNTSSTPHRSLLNARSIIADGPLILSTEIFDDYSERGGNSGLRP